MRACKRGHSEWEHTGNSVECVPCRRERQRSWRYQLNERKRYRQQANARDNARIADLLQDLERVMQNA